MRALVIAALLTTATATPPSRNQRTPSNRQDFAIGRLGKQTQRQDIIDDQTGWQLAVPLTVPAGVRQDGVNHFGRKRRGQNA